MSSAFNETKGPLGNGGAPESSKTGERLDAHVIRPAGDHGPWSSALLEEGRSLTYRRAKDILASVLVLPAPADYDAFLLSLAQTYLYDLLTKVWHLGIVGTRSAGKSTGLRIWAFLAAQTFITGPATSAALIDLMGTAHGVALDEVDETLDRRGDDGKLVEGVLRLGTDRGNLYMHRVPASGGRGWKTIGVDPFCPAAFTYTGKLDDALTSRCDTIRMARLVDPKTVRRRAKHYREHLAPVKVWVEYEAGEALVRWGPRTARIYEESAEFIREADQLSVDLPRTGEIGELMLLVARFMKWPVSVGTIQGRLAEIDGSAVDEVAEEVKAAILRLTDESGEVPADRVWALPTADIREAVNLGRGTRERPIAGNTVVRALRELGINEFGRVSRTDKRHTAVIRRVDRVRWLGPEVVPSVVQAGTAGAGPHSTDVTLCVPTPGPDGGHAAGSGPVLTEDRGSSPPLPASPPAMMNRTGWGSRTGFVGHLSATEELPIDRAVRTLGPTITYPDWRVTDRRTGAIIAYPRDWPSVGSSR